MDRLIILGLIIFCVLVIWAIVRREKSMNDKMNEDVLDNAVKKLIEGWND